MIAVGLSDMLVSALSKIVVMPPDVATYDVAAADVQKILGCAPEVVPRLRAAGLPAVETEAGPLFEFFDVLNVARFCGSGTTTPERNATMLLRFARRPAAAWLGTRDWRVDIRLPGSDPDRFRVRPPAWGAPGLEQLPPPAGGPAGVRSGYPVRVRLEGRRDVIRSAGARAVYEDMLHDLRAGRVTYQGVCEPLRAQHDRAWGLGMADCIVASRLLAERLRAQGHRARARRGLLLGLVGSEHAWCEVAEDGRWKSLDVVLAAVPTGLTTREPSGQEQEFVAACLGSRLNRLLPCRVEDAGPLVEDTVRGRRTFMVGLVTATEDRT